jgi:hypothetical protein
MKKILTVSLSVTSFLRAERIERMNTKRVAASLLSALTMFVAIGGARVEAATTTNLNAVNRGTYQNDSSLTPGTDLVGLGWKSGEQEDRPESKTPREPLPIVSQLSAGK